MAIEVIVPRQGWTMEEGTFVEWLKQNGERVEEGDKLFVIETDKAAAEIETFDSGVLYLPPDGPQRGDIVKVGQLLAYLLADGEEPPTAPLTRAGAEKQTPKQGAGGALEGGALEATGSPARAATVGRKNGPTISPRAVRRATELGVDWTRLKGSGRTGRVREADVLLAARQQPTPPPSTEGVTEIPVTGIRKLIAARMRDSLSSTAQLTLSRPFDASSLVSLKQQLKERQGEQRVTLNDIVICVVSRVLARHPGLNAHFLGNRIVQVADVHIGIAVDTPRGLIVPVLRQANRKPLAQIASETKELADATQGGKIEPGRLQGATFTVTNLGSLDIEYFTPVLNPPEVAVLGLGGLFLRPVRTEAGIDHVDAMHLSLTIDHQAVDGAPAARFLADLATALEDAPRNTA